MELDSKMESRPNNMMRLKSFDTQGVREIGRKEGREAFPSYGPVAVVAVNKERLEATARHLAREKGKQKNESDSSGHVAER